ncbi:MAG: hypothetical protein E7203_10070 [Selenomonas ruminantium]|uniref:Uncharacterized protein n=1 Tax=Selenomonas ruminantium TaxID=971 RepID=A0A927WM93_SELRU|nr:hypothetical protein [Selenomonas ruminantium]MBE6085777.1 hypothetical protein [Selenomonas ruminantium]
MMYPFMTLDNEAEITHSEYMDDGRVKVYVEKADEKDGFHHLTCYLPSYEITDVYGFDKEEQEKYMEVIRSTAHLIMEFSKDGGFENASGF